MGIESVAGIWDLNKLWPLSSDDRSTSDDHHRLIKEAILETLPNISATIAVSAAEINHLSGVTTNIQTKLNDLSAAAAGGASHYVVISSGSTAVAAPAGWTVSRSATGLYRITHNLGLTNAVASAAYFMTVQTYNPLFRQANTNDFLIGIVNDGNTAEDANVWINMKIL